MADILLPPLSRAPAAPLLGGELHGFAPRAPLTTPDRAQPGDAANDRRGPLRPGRLISPRKRIADETLSAVFAAADVVVIIALVWLVHDLFSPSSLWASTVRQAAPFFASGVLLIYGLALAETHGLRAGEAFSPHLTRLGAAFALTGAALAGALAIVRAPAGLFAALAAWLMVSFSAVYALHAAWWASLRWMRRTGRLVPNIVVVGATENAERLIARALERRDVAVLGVFDDRKSRKSGSLGGVPFLGDTSALIGHRIMPYVDRVVITISCTAPARVRALVDKLRVMPNDITLFIDLGGMDPDADGRSRLSDIPLAQLAGRRANVRRAIAKRAQDLILGVLALVAAAPLMLLVAAAVKLDSPGPILFRQRRHGFNNEEIVVWKFRSMRHDQRDEAGVRQVECDDVRVTRVGRFIRQASLDELPQIFNVLKGEMSLVGPRPHALNMKTGEVESARLVAEYAHRHRIKPGMTGWAAIKGSRGPVDTAALVRRRVALDLDYIERQSFWLDLYIMAMTLPCLLGDRQAAR